MENNNMKQVILSDAALEAARRIRDANPEYQGQDLRLYLDGKDCDGFLYGVSFDQASSEDTRIPYGDIDLLVDKDTLGFVVGSNIDWVDDERGQGFLVTNPGHKKYRGKFFKRKDWQKRLQGAEPQNA